MVLTTAKKFGLLYFFLFDGFVSRTFTVTVDSYIDVTLLPIVVSHPDILFPMPKPFSYEHLYDLKSQTNPLWQSHKSAFVSSLENHEADSFRECEISSFERSLARAFRPNNSSPNCKKSCLFKSYPDLYILRRIRIVGSVHWITDPDPALFFSGFRCITYYSTFTSVFKDNKFKTKSKRTVEIKVFLNFLLVDGRTRIRKHNCESGSWRPKTSVTLLFKN